MPLSLSLSSLSSLLLPIASSVCLLSPVACSRVDYHLFCSIWQANAKWVDELSLLFSCLNRECVDSAGYFCEFWLKFKAGLRAEWERERKREKERLLEVVICVCRLARGQPHPRNAICDSKWAKSSFTTGKTNSEYTTYIHINIYMYSYKYINSSNSLELVNNLSTCMGGTDLRCGRLRRAAPPAKRKWNGNEIMYRD